MRKKRTIRKDHHHTIPMALLLIPGIIMIISLFLFISGLQEWSYLVMGMAIVIAILIHREDN